MGAGNGQVRRLTVADPLVPRADAVVRLEQVNARIAQLEAERDALLRQHQWWQKFTTVMLLVNTLVWVVALTVALSGLLE